VLGGDLKHACHELAQDAGLDEHLVETVAESGGEHGPLGVRTVVRLQSQIGNRFNRQLFTWTSLGTLWGAAAGAFVVANGLGVLFGFLGSAVKYVRLWAAFVVALGIELLLAASVVEGGRNKWVIAVLNGFLVFTSAMGLNEGLDRLPKPPPPGLSQAERKRLVVTWLRP